jgi:ribose transport system ATP-binding protein
VSAARLEVRGVRKAYGGVPALADATLDVARGEIHAVLGQNGAGKSTLMNVLAGDTRPDGGHVLLDGAPFTPGSPLEARRAGVLMVHQELSLCPHLSVAENVMLGELPTRNGLVDREAMHRRAAEVLAAFVAPGEPPIPVDAPAGDLPLAAQQLVEIGRALSQRSCKVLILDEPTSSLASADVERLFVVLRALRAGGDLAILYLSHFLEEVKAIADGFTVLRDGATVASGRVADVTAAELVERMVGRPVDALFPRTARAPGEVALAIAHVAGERGPRDASLVLRRGEVLGVAGLVGSGRTELLRAIFGLDRVRSGEISVLAHVNAHATPAERLAEGVGMASEDRKAEGLCVGLSIADNLTLSRLEGLGPGPFMLPSRQAAAAAKWMERLGVRAVGPTQPVGELSGGNQQKVALARLLHHDVDVLLLDEPTRGVDVEAKAQIYALIDGLAARGKAVLVVSSYLPELLGMCDRVHVMARGALGPAHDVADVDEASLLAEASGA